MKKIILALALIGIIGIMPMAALAAQCSTYETKDTCESTTDDDNCIWDMKGTTVTTDDICRPGAPDIVVMDALDRIINWLFAILVIIAALFLILAAIGYTTAQGDPDKIAAAGQKVLYAMIGVAVAILAKGLVILIQLVVGGAAF